MNGLAIVTACTAASGGVMTAWVLLPAEDADTPWCVRPQVMIGIPVAVTVILAMGALMLALGLAPWVGR